MVDVKNNVKKALEAIEGVTAFFYYPNTFNKLPCISYYEASNTPEANADDDEYLSEIAYVLDVWGADDKSVTNIVSRANAAMKTLGFRRVFSHDAHNPGSNARHKTMRFALTIGDD